MDRSLDDILQFANIPRQGYDSRSSKLLLFTRANVLSRFPRVTVGIEVCNQHRNVFPDCSRRGGTSMGKTLSRYNRSAPKVPAAMAACKSRFVAAITLEHCFGWNPVPPTSFKTSRSCRTRNRATCVSAGSSPDFVEEGWCRPRPHSKAPKTPLDCPGERALLVGQTVPMQSGREGQRRSSQLDKGARRTLRSGL